MSMGTWFVRPDNVTLPLSDDQWIRVKKRLNAGQQRSAFTRMYIAGVDGTLKVNPLQTGMALITAYLLDWSLIDENGELVAIRGVSVDDLAAMLDSLDPDRFAEIKTAIEVHEQAMVVEREKEKNVRDGGMTAPATLPSPSAVTGELIGSVS